MTITLLPNGEQQFWDNSGNPLANGLVYFYIPTTFTPKDTWKDPAQGALNTNPVQLDANGRAIIYGYGAYRQIVKDSIGNTIWDQLTQDTSELIQDGQLIWGGVSTGAANAYTIALTPVPAQRMAGQRFCFKANFTNTGPATLDVGLGPVALTKTGATALGAGDITNGQICEVVDDGTEYQLINPIPAPAVSTPTGCMSPFGGAAAPSGWVLCAGQAISRVAFAALFAVIGTTYGVGDGVNTFNVPDLRGRAPFGLDNMGGTPANRVTNAGSGIQGTVLGASGGAENETLTIAQIPAHDHVYTPPGPQIPLQYISGGAAINGLSQGPANTSQTGGGQPHPNMPPTLITTWIIKT